MNKRADIMLSARKVVALGLNIEQVNELQNHLSSCTVFQVKTVEELLATPAAVWIIFSSKLHKTIIDFLIESYNGILGAKPMVFWLGWPKPPFYLRCKFQCPEYFEQLVWGIQNKERWRNYFVQDTNVY